MLPGRIVDLTLPFRKGMAGYALEPSKSLEHDGWNATTMHIFSHAGTHMDAPVHFGVSGQTVDQLPPERWLGPAWVVPLEGIDPAALITVADLGLLSPKIKAGDNLLFRTGWSKKVDHPDYRDRLPRISEELARWLVEKKVNLVGVEPPSVADVHNLEEVTLIHQILLGGDIIIVEGLCNLDLLRQEQVFFMACPLKIEGGDGAPVRALAVESET